MIGNKQKVRLSLISCLVIHLLQQLCIINLKEIQNGFLIMGHVLRKPYYFLMRDFHLIHLLLVKSRYFTICTFYAAIAHLSFTSVYVSLLEYGLHLAPPFYIGKTRVFFPHCQNLKDQGLDVQYMYIALPCGPLPCTFELCFYIRNGIAAVSVICLQNALYRKRLLKSLCLQSQGVYLRYLVCSMHCGVLPNSLLSHFWGHSWCGQEKGRRGCSLVS